MSGKTKSEPLAPPLGESAIVGKPPGGGPVPPGGSAIMGKPPGGESVPPGGATLGLGHSFDALLSYKLTSFEVLFILLKKERRPDLISTPWEDSLDA